MESQDSDNSFIPVDPFKASIGFSIKNIWRARHAAANDEANDIYLRPAAPLKTSNLADLRNNGVVASSRRGVSSHITGPSYRLPPQLFQPAGSAVISTPAGATDGRARAEAGGRPQVVSNRLSSDFVVGGRQDYVPEPDQKPGSHHGSRFRSQSLSLPINSTHFDHRPIGHRHAAPSMPFHQIHDRPPVPSISPSRIPPLNIEKYDTATYLLAFILDTVPRQIYLHLLLRLPYMYFSRVTRIFEEAEMSMPQIKQGILRMAMQTKEPLAQRWLLEGSLENVAFKNLENTWQAFIDSVLREWKTLNIISVLLLSAILTILQIDDASKDPLTRYTAVISMICALMSLLYGCMYIIRFGTMRKSYKAAEWANEAKKTTQSITWNIWVLLAMPAAWLAWSIILFVVCIMSFVWRTGTVEDDVKGPVTRDQVLAARIIVTLVLSLGLVYLVLITTTLRRYGEMMDRAWHRRILSWVNDTSANKFPLVSEKVTAQGVPTAIPPVTPSSAPIGAPTAPRPWGANVAPAINLNHIPPRKRGRNVLETVIPSGKTKTGVSADATTAKASDGLLSDFLPQEDKFEQRPKYLQGIKMLELYHLFSFPEEKVDIKSEKFLRSNDKVWQSLKPDVWVTFEAALRLSWDPHSPECILPLLDKFNTASADTIGGQLALCHKIQSDKLKYAIFFFSFTGPLPHDKSYYESIPFHLDYLDIWISLPTASSSSVDPGMDTKIVKISLPSKRPTNPMTNSVVLPIT